MRSNTLFVTIVFILLVAHAASLVGICFSARGMIPLLALNALCAMAILLYLASRATYLIAAKDWLQFGLFIFELTVLLGAILAYRGHRIAVVGSYIAFGLHTCTSLAAVVFAFTFKLTKLM